MIGAGLCLRTKALNGYLIKVEDKPVRLELDRVGKSLMSSGDNDIGETIQELGWLTGYFPQIQVTHIIPKERLSLNYMAKLNRGIRKGVVINSFFHGRIPYPPIHSYTLPLRFIKSYFRYKAWQSPENYIMWQGACGIYEGQTIIKKMKNQIKL